MPEAACRADVAASRGWRRFRFEGPVPLDQTGILASVTGPLAAARVSVFAVATYDTDYVLVPDAQRNAAIAALEARRTRDQREAVVDGRARARHVLRIRSRKARCVSTHATAGTTVGRISEPNW